ncbi:SAM-dependent methyltransferase [Desulfogranum mediterraneum]|uniref:SAM-dependent methyltransferase n=1 Tax=Desulfogranum mediterraneum TaxID=160661 RepID=UPI00048B5676|nr:RlmE family RNA methyltransferase [Desulfogranum mediterraneum]
MRKPQDFYFNKAKKDNYPARSVYKLEEVQQKYRFLKKRQRVIDFGCHPGSWSIYAAEVVGEQGVVVGVDLQPTDIPQQKPNAEIHWLCYDVFADDLVEELRRQWQGFHVVLSDMAPRTTGSQYADHQQSMRLVRRVLELSRSLLHENGTFYCKAFQGEDFPQVVEECKPFFQTVKVVKPKSSRKESREVFILGRGFRPRAQPA